MQIFRAFFPRNFFSNHRDIHRSWPDWEKDHKEAHESRSPFRLPRWQLRRPGLSFQFPCLLACGNLRVKMLIRINDVNQMMRNAFPFFFS
jgi:hypothetical protein